MTAMDGKYYTGMLADSGASTGTRDEPLPFCEEQWLSGTRFVLLLSAFVDFTLGDYLLLNSRTLRAFHSRPGC